MSRPRPLTHVLLIGLLGSAFGLGQWMAPAADNLATARELSSSFQTIASDVSPAVVSIRCRVLSGNGYGRVSQGSGVVVRESGIVVTNHHVVRDAVDCEATFPDGRKVEARILGSDDEADLAVLQLEVAGSYATADLRTEPVSVGEWVLAMGNPRGIGHTVTAGIVSGTDRVDLGITTFEDFIQTDASINSGNSGGPLVDIEGQVVGINTAVGTPFAGTVGIGFAIPTYMVERTVDEILSVGRVRRGWLGVNMRTLDDDAARERGYSGSGRVMIRNVIDDSPAAEAGIRDGDIVLEADGNTIAQRSDLLNAIGARGPGDTITLRIWRDGRPRLIDVVLTERNPPNEVR